MCIEADEDGEKFEGPCAELVGVLVYIENTVRPAIGFAVGKHARSNAAIRSTINQTSKGS